MATDKEVQLIIRAKDEAKKTVNAITGALKEFTQQQQKTSEQAGETNSLIGELGREFANLDRQVRGLGALAKAQGRFQKLTASIEEQGSKVKRNQERTAKLVQEYGEASKRTARLRTEADKASVALAQQANKIEKLKEAQRSLRGERSPDATDSRQLLRERLREEREEFNRLKTASDQANKILGISEGRQSNLRRSAVEATKSLRDQRQELGQLTGLATKSSKVIQSAKASLQATAESQDGISREATEAASDLDRVSSALRRQQDAATGGRSSGGPAAQATEAYRKQVQAVRDAERAYREAREEATKLGGTLRNTAQPSQKLQTSFLLSKEASAAARAEYIKQAQALRKLQTGATSASGSFAKFEDRVREIQGRTTGMVGATESAARSQQDVARRLHGTGAAAKSAGNQLRGFGAAFKKVSNEQRKALSFTQRLRGEIVSLTVAYLGLYQAINQTREIVDAFRAVEAVESRLGVVFEQDTQRVGQEVEFLRAEAIRLGFSFEVLGDTYSKFAVAANKAGFAASSVRSIFISVAESARVNKVSMDQLRGTFIALEQMISKGKITSEELRRQLGDRMPGAFNFFAEALGMTTAELDKAMDRGEVFATESNLLNFADKLNEEFGAQLPTALETLTAQMGRFQALLFDMRATIARAGFAEEMRTSIDELNEAFQSEEGRDFAERIGQGLSSLTRIVVAIIKNFDTLLAILQLFIAAKFARAIGGWAISLQNMNKVALKSDSRIRLLRMRMNGLIGTLAAVQTRTIAARAGIVGLTGAMVAARAVAVTLAASFAAIIAAMGGWVGILLTVVSLGLGYLFADMITSADAGTEALRTHRDTLRDVRKEYEKAKGAADDWTESLKDASKAELVANLTRLREQLRETVEEIDGSFFNRNFAVGTENITEARTRQALQPLVDQFKAGQIGARDLRDEINALYADAEKSGERISATIVAEALKFADTAAELESAAEDTEKLLLAMETGSREAAEEVLGLNDALEDNEAAVRAADALEKYEEALRGVKEFIPELRDELKKLDDLNALEGLRQTLERNGEITPDVQSLLDRARTEINKDPEDEKRQERIQAYLESREDLTRQLELERSLIGESAKEQFVLKELARQEAAARQAGAQYTREMKEADRTRAAELFALQNREKLAAERRKRVEESVNQLMELRRALMEQIDFHEGQGQFETARQLKEQLNAVNLSLEEAVAKAIRFWQAIGGPEADLAIAKLQNVKNSIKEVNDDYLPSTEELAKDASQGMAGAFSSFIGAIVTGQNAMKSFGDTIRQFFANMLRKIAEAIIQALILRAIMSALGLSGGGGLGAGYSPSAGPPPVKPSVLHDGGVAGESSETRSVSPGWFRGALRYHGGGIAGLRPGEVPAILERNEEVLTEDDPRHVKNGGGGGSSAQNIKVVNTIDSGSFVSEGMNTKTGERAILNFIRANQGAVKNALGV